MAEEASSVQTTLHANKFFLVELSGTRIWRTYGEANTSRGVSQCAGAD